MTSNDVNRLLAAAAWPADDGWAWLYRLADRVAPPGTTRRELARRYFLPSKMEMAGNGRLYRCLGVPVFGRVIPTGGIVVRRLTRARMRAYTLAGTSLRAAREFYFRACVFETLHLPFFLALAALSLQRALTGRMDFAVQETLINLAVNVYPMLHHRNTRRRIVVLLDRRGYLRKQV